MADNELGELYGPVGEPRGDGFGLGRDGRRGDLAGAGRRDRGLGLQLMMRDVNGIPVVRALDGPMRMAPTDPGGESGWPIRAWR